VLTVANPNHLALQSVQLYTLLGQLVYEKKVDTATDVLIDMQTLQKGAYLLKVKSSENEKSYSVLKN
jgi:hypothetical protein